MQERATVRAIAPVTFEQPMLAVVCDCPVELGSRQAPDLLTERE